MATATTVMGALPLELLRTGGCEQQTLTSMLPNESSTEAMGVMSQLLKNSATMQTQLMATAEVPLARSSLGISAQEQLARLLLVRLPVEMD